MKGSYGKENGDDAKWCLFDLNAEAQSNKGMHQKYNHFEVTVFCNAHLRSFNGTAEKSITRVLKLIDLPTDLLLIRIV